MFELFAARARQAVVLAQEGARTLKHNYIGTEHILLGLLREEEGLAARVLESLDITVERVRAQVVRIVGSGEEVPSDSIPFTLRAKTVLQLALREAASLGHNYIATEHILLGLVRENEGVAARILLAFDADSEKIRKEVIRMLSVRGRRVRREPANDSAVSGASLSASTSGAVQEAPQREPCVFLCHTSKDKEYIRRLDRRLREDAIKTWLDERDLLPGQEWDPAIQEAVRAADVVVVCLSSSSINNSGWADGIGWIYANAAGTASSSQGYAARLRVAPERDGRRAGVMRTSTSQRVWIP